MQQLKINKSVLIIISFLITLFLFFIAGNLIFVEQRTSILTLDSIEFIKASDNESKMDKEIMSSPIFNSEKYESKDNLNDHKTSKKTVPSKFNLSSVEKVKKPNSILSLEGDYFPLLKLKPNYPSRALEKGREGFCLVNYTIKTNGTVGDVTAVEAECNDWFREASIDAAKSFVYKPRVKNAISQKVKNVRNKFVFKIREN